MLLGDTTFVFDKFQFSIHSYDESVNNENRSSIVLYIYILKLMCRLTRKTPSPLSSHCCTNENLKTVFYPIWFFYSSRPSVLALRKRHIRNGMYCGGICKAMSFQSGHRNNTLICLQLKIKCICRLEQVINS